MTSKPAMQDTAMQDAEIQQSHKVSKAVVVGEQSPLVPVEASKWGAEFTQYSFKFNKRQSVKWEFEPSPLLD